MIDKILDMLEARIRKYIDKTYKLGYEAGTADAERRMSKIYDYGYRTGHSDTMAMLGLIDIEEIDPDVYNRIAPQ